MQSQDLRLHDGEWGRLLRSCRVGRSFSVGTENGYFVINHLSSIIR